MLKVVSTEATDGVDGRSLLDEIAREGARRMLVAALEAEVAAYVDAQRAERDADGHALVVPNGKGRTRTVTVGAGTIPVNAPRVNDRRMDAHGERRRFTSRILPPYMRRSPKVAEVLPVLYLRGLSTGDFREALTTLLGKDAAGLSATSIARLTNEWGTEYRALQQRRLADRDYVYVWVDGVHFNVRVVADVGVDRAVSPYDRCLRDPTQRRERPVPRCEHVAHHRRRRVDCDLLPVLRDPVEIGHTGEAMAEHGL